LLKNYIAPFNQNEVPEEIYENKRSPGPHKAKGIRGDNKHQLPYSSRRFI